MRKPVAVTALLLLALMTASCGERIVYRDRDLIGELPTGAGGYAGFANVETRLTVCGNCHVSQQNQWALTAHATATAGQGASDPPLCLGCHNTSPVGNTGTSGGMVATRDPRYVSVQCESCHGPGEAHARNPDGGTVQAMLARISAAPGAAATCMECHSGFHHPYVEEWAGSGHGRVIASPAGNPACSGCHEAKAALRAFGVLSVYQEMNDATALPITCAVCHDPHRAEHQGQLRYSINVPDEQQNLCMRCHNKRGGPDFAAQNRGPHSPEGPMLLGEAGWWPPNMPIQPGTVIETTHGSAANPRMCAGCHMHQVAAQDAARSITVPTTAHRFDAIPCLDAQGQPTSGTCGLQQRTFRTCTGAGCHGSEGTARSAMQTVRLRLDSWNAQLQSQLARVPAAEFNPNDNRYSTAEGARFNGQLSQRSGSAVHNPFLMEALLIGSIQQVQRDYDIAPQASAGELDAALRDVLHKAALKAAAMQQ